MKTNRATVFWRTACCTLALLALGAIAGQSAHAAATQKALSPFFGSAYNVIVRSPGGNPSGSQCVTQLQSDFDGSPPYGYITYVPPVTRTFAQITILDAVFSFPVGNYGGGSPRFEIPVDTSGDGSADGSVFVYIGTPPNFTDAGHSSFDDTGNVVLDITTTRWDLSQFGGLFNATYPQAVTFFAGKTSSTVLDVELVVDGGWKADQMALVDSFTVNSDTYLTTCVPTPPVPTLSPWGLAILLAALVGVALRSRKRA